MCEGCVADGSISRFLYDVIQAFLDREEYESQAYGPAHIVLDDDNVNDECIRWCLDNSDDQGPWRPFLEWMLTITEAERVPKKA